MNYSNLLKNLSKIARPFINNKFIAPSPSHISKTLINPATEEPLIQVVEGIPSDVDLAVQVATDALHSWSSSNGADRRNILLKIADGIDKYSENLALIESLNVGKPIKDAKLDVSESAECFSDRFFAGYADKLAGHNFCVNDKYRTFTIREPVGVCGLITSFNYPLSIASWKLAPSLACGNTVILKPAPQTPLTTLMLAEIISSKTELPPGVLNVIPGDEKVGERITEHEGIDKCSFTGSIQVGRKILSAASSSNLKRITLELGGKNAMIVFSDVDVDKVVDDVYWASFLNSGQNCCAGSRLFLEKSIHNVFIDKLRKRIGQTKIGNPLSEKVDFGPLIDNTQFQRMLRVLKDTTSGLKDGKLLIGGNRVGDVGFFIEPTVFYNIEDSEIISQEEIFGPLLTILKPFDTIEEVIHRANNTKFGLSVGIWTNNYSKAEKAIKEMKVGTAWINCYNLSPNYLPFGGRKSSGFGKDLGEESIDEFSFIKSATFAL